MDSDDNTEMGHCWPGPHSEQNCLIMAPLTVNLNLNLIQGRKDVLGGQTLDPLTVPPPNMCTPSLCLSQGLISWISLLRVVTQSSLLRLLEPTC